MKCRLKSYTAVGLIDTPVPSLKLLHSLQLCLSCRPYHTYRICCFNPGIQDEQAAEQDELEQLQAFQAIEALMPTQLQSLQQLVERETAGLEKAKSGLSTDRLHMTVPNCFSG